MTNIPTAKGEELKIYYIDSETGSVLNDSGTARMSGGTVNNKVGDILNNADTYFSYICEDGMENLVEKDMIISIMPVNVKPKREMKLKEVGISIKVKAMRDRISGIVNIGEGSLQQIFEKKMFIPVIMQMNNDANDTRLLLVNKKHCVGKISTIRI